MNGPRLAPVPAPDDRGPGGDGYGPDSLGRRVPRRVPAVALDSEVYAQALRALVVVPAPRLAAMLRVLADRLLAARADRDSGEAKLTIRWNRGALASCRWNGDDELKA